MTTGPRVLVCGSRHWSDYSAIVEAITALEPMPSLIIHGGATGADSLAGTAAHYLSIPVQVFKAPWVEHGRAAGFIRNRFMLIEGRPDLILAFASPCLAESKGTAHMVALARKAGIPVQLTELHPAATLPLT
jgi:hypothetical protein